MVLPRNRSKNKRKTIRKTVRGSKEIYLDAKNPGPACALCNKRLAGAKQVGSSTEKSVSRRFGGHLCHSCLTHIVKESVRVKEKAKSIDAVDLVEKKYVQLLLK